MGVLTPSSAFDCILIRLSALSSYELGSALFETEIRASFEQYIQFIVFSYINYEVNAARLVLRCVIFLRMTGWKCSL